MVVTVQKEVADRMAAPPGSGAYGALSLIVQAHGAVEVLRRVPPEVFWPKPKVVSAIVRIVPDPARRGQIRDYGAFREVVRASFAHRRKTLANSLAASGIPGGKVERLLAACGLAHTARAEGLGLANYVRLANQLDSLDLGGRRVEDEGRGRGRGRL
jgi:16S rRNA (adenine1518-N6/adenine1519-N6)-dimethyltransferase